jgi:hypothetical protein
MYGLDLNRLLKIYIFNKYFNLSHYVHAEIM